MSSTDTSWRARVGEHESLARIVWSYLAEPRDPKASELIGMHGYPRAVAQILTHPAKWPNFTSRLEALDLPNELARMKALGVQLLVPTSNEWPSGLDDLPEPPHCLFVRGSAQLGTLCARSAAVVGARAASPYGESTASDIAAGLVTRGFSIISGGAFGIDAAAHRGALAGQGMTVCVVAGGVDVTYPRAHDALFNAIRAHGAIVSEMPLGAAPMRQRFLHRNRLIAALSPGTVVVEAGLRSGSLSTARRAEELNRLVGAVPGPVTSPSSAGCHELIREGGACLVTGAADIAELLGDYGEVTTTADEREVRVTPVEAVSATAQLVWDALPLRAAAPVENIARVSGRDTKQVITALGELELAKLAERAPGGWRKCDATTPGARRA